MEMPSETLTFAEQFGIAGAPVKSMASLYLAFAKLLKEEHGASSLVEMIGTLGQLARVTATIADPEVYHSVGGLMRFEITRFHDGTVFWVTHQMDMRESTTLLALEGLNEEAEQFLASCSKSS